MKLFLSWSGSLSHQISIELREWFRIVLPTIEPFVSTEDIRKGGHWSTILANKISQSDRGIVCVTKSNFEKPWLQYETGALQQSHQEPIVYTLLVDAIRPEHLHGNPLSLFQHTQFDREDFRKLVGSLNNDLSVGARSVADLDDVFGQYWPRLEQRRNELLRSKSYTQNVIYLPELARETPIIAGQNFEDIVFKGPAIIALLDFARFTECGFRAPTIESMIWERDPKIPIVDAIGLSRCSFTRCEFEGIGFTGTPEVLEMLRKIELAIEVMRQSVHELRKDGKASPTIMIIAQCAVHKSPEPNWFELKRQCL